MTSQPFGTPGQSAAGSGNPKYFADALFKFQISSSWNRPVSRTVFHQVGISLSSKALASPVSALRSSFFPSQHLFEKIVARSRRGGARPSGALRGEEIGGGCRGRAGPGVSVFLVEGAAYLGVGLFGAQVPHPGVGIEVATALPAPEAVPDPPFGGVGDRQRRRVRSPRC